nr:callose synthase 3 [Tanacetum cinerariifolium]
MLGKIEVKEIIVISAWTFFVTTIYLSFTSFYHTFNNILIYTADNSDQLSSLFVSPNKKGSDKQEAEFGFKYNQECARLESKVPELEELLEMGDCVAHQPVDCSFTNAVWQLNLEKTEAIKSKGGRSKHSRWRNHDDLNEYFWSADCFRLGWPIRKDTNFFCQQDLNDVSMKCEPFPTYPRTYDMLHANGLLSYLMSEQCSITNLLLEMHRILRPEVHILI